MVFVTPANASTLATFTTDDGTWFVQLSKARTPDLQSFSTIKERETPLEISVISQGLEIASTFTFPYLAKPTQDIVFGQVPSFLEGVNQRNFLHLPEPDLNVKGVATQSSRFKLFLEEDQ